MEPALAPCGNTHLPLSLTDLTWPNKLVAELHHIANVMEIPSNVKRKQDLRNAIHKTLPRFADDACFESLLAYRINPVPEKTSADKEDEVLAEEQGPVVPEKGAHKKLLDASTTVDPPPRSLRLHPARLIAHDKKMVSKKQDADEQNEGEETESESLAPTPAPSVTESDTEGFERRNENIMEQVPILVRVNLFDSLKQPIDQVYVDQHKVSVTRCSTGTAHIANLTSLLPEALKNDSPLKARGGRFFRPAPDHGPLPIHLGSVDAISRGAAPGIKVQIVDQYQLRQEGDLFNCDIFWSPASGEPLLAAASRVVDAETDHMGGNGDPGCPPALLNIPAGDLPPNAPVFTGTLSDGPKHIADTHTSVDPFVANADPRLRPEFEAWLYALVKLTVPNIPDRGDEWKKCKTAADLLERYKVQSAIFAALSGMQAGTTAYRVPIKSALWPGVRFKKSFALLVFGLKTSNTDDIARYFNPDVTCSDAEIEEWVVSDGKENEHIGRLKTKMFKDRLAPALKSTRTASSLVPELDRSARYSAQLTSDLTGILGMLGFYPADFSEGMQDPRSLFPALPVILVTKHLFCVFCPVGDLNLAPTLRRREKPHTIWLLTSQLAWVQADVFVAHCASCQADYHPDCVTFRVTPENRSRRLQKLDFDADYIRVSKHGVWVLRRVAEMQESALKRFHGGWSNFADWINDVTQSERTFTYRQAQRLFIEHSARRLLVFHDLGWDFTCRPHSSASSLSKAVREAVGENGGSSKRAMMHSCTECTHLKRYRSDLVKEGVILEDASAQASRGVAGLEDEEEELALGLDGVQSSDDPALDQLASPIQQGSPPEGSPRGYVRLAVMDGKTITHRPDLIRVEVDSAGRKHQTRAFNTETAEQLNSWLSGFESQLRQMTDFNYDFFVHVLFMIYSERVESQVRDKEQNLDDDFWEAALGTNN
ncbi:unnamed protein product [Mycena citricolor]|uniref:CxC5 like cysteine cluster associated with KDZ domain-containing protein n=1 Tax=Mycena citricolor TaxID=2018698 RepID=A0AAD2HN08_9AGAR|nr:unnamed protein product [Mycena citricolor]